MSRHELPSHHFIGRQHFAKSRSLFLWQQGIQRARIVDRRILIRERNGTWRCEAYGQKEAMQ
jgi:hypothetical protein